MQRFKKYFRFSIKIGVERLNTFCAFVIVYYYYFSLQVILYFENVISNLAHHGKISSILLKRLSKKLDHFTIYLFLYT